MRISLPHFVLILTLILSGSQSIAQTNGDYRSNVVTNNWNNAATWQMYTGGWANTATPPTSASGVITITSGSIISLTANVTADQIVVSSGGTLIIKDGITLTLNNGTGTDLDVYGTVQEVGTGGTGASITINAGATIVFESTGIYQHNFSSTTTQGNIPIATWNDGSTCEMIGFTGNGGVIHAGNFNQSFSNFLWNCPNQTSAYGMQGLLTTVRNNFTMQSSGSPAQIVYGLGASSSGLTMTIGDSMIISGGIFDFANVGASGSFILNIGSAYYQTGGTFQNDFVSGMTVNFTGSAGTFTRTPSGTFTSTYMNLFVVNGAILTLNDTLKVATTGFALTVSLGGTLYCGANVINGAGNFTLSQGGTLGIGSPNGITSSGASGNIQVTGTRSFNTIADYIYDGVSAQNSGNGLPAQVSNLTLNNASNCTLTASTSASDTIFLISGIWIATSDTLTLGKNVGSPGTLSVTSGWVYGYFRRWVAIAVTPNILFPVGSMTNYNPANVSFTVAPAAGGTVTATFIASNPGTLGLPMTDAGDVCVNVGYAYWAFNTGNSFAGGTFTLNLYATGFPGINDYTKLHIFSRTGSGSPWTTNGTHAAGTGSNAAPVVNRTGMTTFSNFGIVSASVNPLPVELISFDAAVETSGVLLSWITASEINNDYFTIARSRDGLNFVEIIKQPGHGNSNTLLQYSAVDNAPAEGINYYRLMQTDYDGKFTCFPIKAVEYGSANHTGNVIIKSIGPNPFKTDFNITYSLDKQEEVALTITNAFGQLVYKKLVNANEGLNVFNFKAGNGLSSGIYIVTLMGDDEVVTKKIIRN